MKTYKTSVGKLNIVVKFVECKGKPDLVECRVYFQDEFGRKKIFWPAEIMDQVFGSSTFEERRELQHDQRWNSVFFSFGGECVTARFSFCPYQKGCSYYGVYKYEEVPDGLAINGCSVSRDYFCVTVEKSKMVSGCELSVMFGSKSDLSKAKKAFDIFEDSSVFSFEKQHKANKSGFNDDVKLYLSRFHGLDDLPDFETEEQWSQWYSELTQTQADTIRRRALSYVNFIWGWNKNIGITQKQLSLIQSFEDGPVLMEKYHYSKKEDGRLFVDKMLASSILDQLNSTVPASEAQKTLILKLEPSADVSKISKHEASVLIEKLFRR